MIVLKIYITRNVIIISRNLVLTILTLYRCSVKTFLNALKLLLSGHTKNFVTLQLLKPVKFYFAQKRSWKYKISVQKYVLKFQDVSGKFPKKPTGATFLTHPVYALHHSLGSCLFPVLVDDAVQVYVQIQAKRFHWFSSANIRLASAELIAKDSLLFCCQIRHLPTCWNHVLQELIDRHHWTSTADMSGNRRPSVTHCHFNQRLKGGSG